MLSFLLATALSASPIAPAPAAADSITGTWRVTGDVVGNPLNQLCTLKQAGAKLTGSCKNTDAADRAFDVTGEVTDSTVTFRHGGEYEGQALTITYTGTPASMKGFKGAVSVMPFGVTGTFAAAPAPAAVPAKP